MLDLQELQRNAAQKNPDLNKPANGKAYEELPVIFYSKSWEEGMPILRPKISTDVPCNTDVQIKVVNGQPLYMGELKNIMTCK